MVAQYLPWWASRVDFFLWPYESTVRPLNADFLEKILKFPPHFCKIDQFSFLPAVTNIGKYVESKT